MKKLLVLLILILATFSSCGTYNISTSYKIKSILTITEKGDTLAVPVRDFKFRILRQDDPLGISIDKTGNIEIGTTIIFQTLM